jgi:hypothetical protein
VTVERLMAGQAFHRTVQSAFLAGLAGASGFRERQIITSLQQLRLAATAARRMAVGRDGKAASRYKP